METNEKNVGDCEHTFEDDNDDVRCAKCGAPPSVIAALALEDIADSQTALIELLQQYLPKL